MATTRNRQAADDEGGTDTQTSGFTEDERSELKALITEAIGSVKAAPAGPESKAAPKVTDDEWDRMSDRQRESYVRSVVDDHLDRLSREDEAARQRADIDALKAATEPAKEGTPEPASLLDRVRRFLWGEQK